MCVVWRGEMVFRGRGKGVWGEGKECAQLHGHLADEAVQRLSSLRESAGGETVCARLGS